MPKRNTKNRKVQEATVNIRVDVRPDTPSHYVNYIAVSHTAYEFTVSACKMPTPLLPEQVELAKSGQQIPLEPLVQLIVPPLLVDGLIKALVDQKVKYETTLAQQVKNNEIQQHTKPHGSVQ